MTLEWTVMVNGAFQKHSTAAVPFMPTTPSPNGNAVTRGPLGCRQPTREAQGGGVSEDEEQDAGRDDEVDHIFSQVDLGWEFAEGADHGGLQGVHGLVLGDREPLRSEGLMGGHGSEGG